MDDMGTEHWLLLAGAVWFGLRLLIFARNVLRAAAAVVPQGSGRPGLALFSSLVGASVAYAAIVAFWPGQGAVAARTIMAVLAAVVGLIAGGVYDLLLTLREWRVVAWLLARKLPRFRAELRSPDPAVRLVAAKSICLMYERARPAIPDLVAVAADDVSDDVRTWSALAILFTYAEQPDLMATARVFLADRLVAVRAIGGALLFEQKVTPIDDAIQPLSDGLMDPNETVAGMSAFWLGKLGKTAAPALPGMHAALFDRNPPNEIVLDTLSEMGEVGAPLLMVVLTHPDPRLRRRAIWILGRMGDDARVAIPALQALQSDSDDGVRHDAADALTRILKSMPPKEAGES